MKKFKHLFTVLLLLFCTVVNAHDFEVGGIFYSITDATNKTVAVTYKGGSSGVYSNEYTGNVVIPESVAYNGNTYSVTSIGVEAFKGCSGLTSIVIPNSVTSIGDDAFYGCSGLTAVYINDLSAWCNIDFENYTSNPLYYAKNLYLNGELVTDLVIPADVTEIKNFAFAYSSGLTSVVIGNSVTSIGEGAFYHSSGLTSVTIGNSVISIGIFAFCGCSSLTSVVIGNSVTSIGNSTFRVCSKLTSVVIGNSVTSIGDFAFDGCSGLTAVYINDLSAWCNIDFENYTSNPLYYAKNLYLNGELVTDLVIPADVTEIKNFAFAYSSGLTSVVIGNSVTSIGAAAFSGCSGLTSVVIPNSVTSIGNYAFEDCSGLTSVEIPNSVTSIGGGAFSGTAWYNNQPNGVVYAGNVLYKYKGTMPNKTSITIKDGTLGIAGSAFEGCSGLTSIEIPNSVTSIGNAAFEDCSKLTSINIPNSVTSIRSWAFKGCYRLTSVVIGNSVTSIGNYAFYECNNLKTVYNFSNLTFTKGSEDFGYIAYYADIVITPVNGISPITSLAELSNSSVYYIYQHYHSKGATSWAVAKDGDALKSNKDLNIEIDEDDTWQQFAILSIDGGVTRYLYHIETQMFVNLDGSLSATPANAINFIAGAYTNTFIAYFDNEHYVNVGGKQQMIIDDWDTPDGGNSCLIIPVGEFDPSNALEMFEGYTTEIDEMQDENEKVVYDLNGRRIVDAEYLERGVYIINGKKVVY